MHRLSEVDIRRFLDATPTHFCKTSATGFFLWLSAGWPSLLGYPEDQMLGRAFMDFIHPEDRIRTREAMAQLDAGEPLVGFSNRYARSDGGYIWIQWSAIAWDGFYYAIATAQGERRSESTQLRESQHLLELAEEFGEIGHWRLDLISNTLYWSTQVFAIHGLDPQAHTPTLESALAAYHPDDRESVRAHLQRAIEEKGGFHTESRLMRSDGEVRTVVARGRAECALDGSVSSVIGIFQDVTDSKRIQARLRETERLHALSTLAAGVAHEINNPLQYITCNLDTARAQLKRAGSIAGSGAGSDADKLDELLAEVEYGVVQVGRVVTELRTFVKREEAEVREPVSLHSVLNTTLSMTRNELRHRTKLTTRMGDLPMVSASYSELVQVFVNLVTNASQALANFDGECAVRISASTRDDGWAVVDVEDTGPGIAPTDQMRIFEPFFTTKGPGEGTGLGLYLSRSIIQRHGGAIEAESKPGYTRFRVTLPPAATSVPVSPTTVEGDERPRILVVDDDALVLKGLATMLEPAYRVFPESDPNAALQRLRVGQRFDLLLLDIMMPGRDGWSVLEEVESLGPQLAQRTVLMTGALDSTHHPARFAQAPVMAKPFRLNELLAVIETLEPDRKSA